MGCHITLWQVSLALAVLCGAAGAAARAGLAGRCVQDKQYWSAEERRCVDCTRCSGPGREVTLRGCDVHRDALCGSISDLRIDWSWLRASSGASSGSSGSSKGSAAAHGGVHERLNTVSEAEALLLDELHHLPAHRPSPIAHHDRLVDFGDDYILPDRPRQPNLKKEKKHHKNKKAKTRPLHLSTDPADFPEFGGGSGDGAELVGDDEDLVDAYRRAHQRNLAARTSTSTTTSSTTTTTPAPRQTTPPGLAEDFIVEKEVVRQRPAGDQDDGVSTRQTFSTAESLVWDWQAGVLVAAVCACLLFFVVAAAYSCQHAWHFRALKKHLDADMEEISARLALMSGMGCEHLHEPGAGGAPGGEKGALSEGRGEYLHSGRQQNEYCLATLPRKTRV